MATGQEQIDTTLKTVRELSEGWKGRSEETYQRLNKIASTLESLSGKLFLKTKAALPHTSAIAKAVEDLSANNTSGSKPNDDFNDALDRLESEVQILKTKMANKDIVIT
jgi:uncharacterized protein YukE